MLYNILNQHYRIPNNRGKTGTNDIMKVSTILDKLAGYIPTEQEAKLRPMQQRGTPVIRALNELIAKGLLNHWRFCKTRKQEYTKAEYKTLEKEYNLFKEAYITFEPSYRDDEFDRHTESFKQDGRIGNTINTKPKRKAKK